MRIEDFAPSAPTRQQRVRKVAEVRASVGEGEEPARRDRDLTEPLISFLRHWFRRSFIKRGVNNQEQYEGLEALGREQLLEHDEEKKGGVRLPNDDQR